MPTLPTDITFRDLIAQNKRNSAILIGVMAVITLTLAMLIGAAVMAYGFGVIRPQGLIIAAVSGGLFMIIGTLWSWFGGAATLLSISGARLIQHADDPQLYNVVEELAIAGGIPTPPVYMIESPALNAFATGRDPQHAAVAITRGLREKLTRDELAGVMAHELSHVRHYDIRLTMLMATMVGMIVLASDVLWQIVRYGGPARRSSDDRDNKGGGPIVLVIIVLAVILALIAPWLARIIQLSVSRQREYLADAGAVELTRYPQGLIDALKKLGADRTPLEAANRATAHLYIVNPILNATDDSDWDSRWSTHPPLTERINRLEALLR